MNLYDFPRIRDLPLKEQGPFELWLNGQTRPLVDDVPMKDQDFFYQWDYDRWKSGRPVID